MADNLETLRKNTQVRNFLDIIAKSEGTAKKGDNGYNVLFGGKTFNGFADHPRQPKDFTDTTGTKGKTTAAGRYGILASTWDGLKGKIGARDFGPPNQDKAAIELIREHGALNDVLNGNYSAAIDKLGHVWASFPSSPYTQPKNTKSELLGSNYAGSEVPVVPAPSAPSAPSSPLINIPSLGNLFNSPISLFSGVQPVTSVVPPKPVVPVGDLNAATTISSRDATQPVIDNQSVDSKKIVSATPSNTIPELGIVGLPDSTSSVDNSQSNPPPLSFGKGTIPAQVVRQNGRHMLAFPENAEEQQFMLGLGNKGYDENTQSAIMTGKGLLDNAFSKLNDSIQNIGALPTDLDDQILKLIDRA